MCRHCRLFTPDPLAASNLCQLSKSVTVLLLSGTLSRIVDRCRTSCTLSPSLYGLEPRRAIESCFLVLCGSTLHSSSFWSGGRILPLGGHQPSFSCHPSSRYFWQLGLMSRLTCQRQRIGAMLGKNTSQLSVLINYHTGGIRGCACEWKQMTRQNDESQ